MCFHPGFILYDTKQRKHDFSSSSGKSSSNDYNENKPNSSKEDPWNKKDVNVRANAETVEVSSEVKSLGGENAMMVKENTALEVTVVSSFIRGDTFESHLNKDNDNVLVQVTTSAKIFSITGTEISRDKSSNKNKSEKFRGSVVADTINDMRCVASYWNGLHIFSVLCACGLAMSILALIPRHNAILDPTFWFEINIPAGFGIILLQAEIFLDFSILIGKNSLISVRLVVKIFLVSLVTWATIFITFYIIWTTMLEYNAPMPLVGLLYFFSQQNCVKPLSTLFITF